MIKIGLSWVLNIALLLVVTAVLTWLYEFFGSSPFFIFFIILASGWSYSKQSTEIQKLHERIMKLEGFDR